MLSGSFSFLESGADLHDSQFETNWGFTGFLKVENILLCTWTQII